MDKFQSHQIARIIMRVRYGIATDEEKRVFEDWIRAGEEHRTLYDRIVSDESLKEYLNLKSDYDRETDYGKLHAGRKCGDGFARGGNVPFQVYGAFKGCYDKKIVCG